VNPSSVLVVDIDPVLRSAICSFLLDQGFIVSQASSCRDAQAQMQRRRPDALVFGVYLASGDALQLLQQARQTQPRVPVLLLAGQAGAPAVPTGADEVLIKPVEMGEIHISLLRILRAAELAAGNKPTTAPEPIDPFLGSSPVIRELKELAQRILPTQSPVLIEGETGAGKGVLARWIHQNGPRASQLFLDLNCGGLSRELLESELFGYQKGAFTSAVSSKPGLLEAANRGTVFLDEIGDMELQIQSKLLKVLEERVFRRLGDLRERAVDVRLISATHRELLDLVQQQRFRSDLFFRINIVLLRVPPLRERVEDIPIFSEHLLRSIAKHGERGVARISRPAMTALQRYSWPGNIRELRNVLERAVLIAEGKAVTPDHLHFQSSRATPSFTIDTAAGTLKQMERAYIRHVLVAERGSVGRAAQRLGIPRSSLYNKMRRFEIAHGTGRAAGELQAMAAD
jgi:DNA-binding NtrC family response regulator